MKNRNSNKKNILYVQTLGGFSVTWMGRQIFGTKNRESQAVSFLQMLLHYRQDGVSQSLLEETLFGDREVGDIRHALRSVIYNTKKRLAEEGLPHTDYIRKENGVYYWAGEIPVQEDAEQFECLLNHAGKTLDPDKKLELLLSAVGCYKGEFLPRQTDMIWVAQEALRYQILFFTCVEEASLLLRAKSDWERMKELGIYAAKVSPFADWEVITMEALVMMEQLNEARKLYDDTVELYLREQGVRPSAKLFEKMGAQVLRRYAVLDSVQSELTEEQTEKRGGYLCSYPVFQGIYHMVGRIMERGGQSVYLMLCTLVDSKGNPMESEAMINKLSSRMEEAICCSVRYGDAVSRYGQGQYLVLLLNISRENCRVVQKRIDQRFLVGRQRVRIQYHVNSILCSAEKPLETTEYSLEAAE